MTGYMLKYKPQTINIT